MSRRERKCFSAAVMRCCSLRGERGLRVEEEGEVTNVKVQMSKGKTQMTNDGIRNTSTKLTETRVNVEV